MTQNKDALEQWQIIDEAIGSLQEHWETLKPSDIQDWLDTIETSSKKLKAALTPPVVDGESIKENTYDKYITHYKGNCYHCSYEAISWTIDHLHAQGYLNAKREGYVMVPIEPTGPMIMYGIHAHEKNDDLPNLGTGPKCVGIYKAMIKGVRNV